MAQDDDHDKTVIGGGLPPLPDPRAPARPDSPPMQAPLWPQAASGAAPQMPGAERTVIGGAAVPPAAENTWLGGGLPVPPPAASGFPAPAAGENTWLGGGLPGASGANPAGFTPPGFNQPNLGHPGPIHPGPGMMPPAPAWGAPLPVAPQAPGYPPPLSPSAGSPSLGSPSLGYPAAAPGFGTGLGQSLGQAPANPFQSTGQGFFPDISTPPQVFAPPAAAARIPLRAALQAANTGRGVSSNPLIAAASNLLVLFGRLRTGMVEMEAMPLMEHVAREIDGYDRLVLAAGVSQPEALVAKYLLCGTADDLVQNLPGSDRGLWVQYSMAARFFQTRDTGVGFFAEAEKAMQAPAQYANLLELMLTCLALGFEGQFRTAQNGAMHLARIRAAIYESLRRVRPRPPEDISVSWLPVLLGGRRRFGGVPVWAVGGIAAALVVGFFATLSTLVNRDGAAAAEALYTLHPGGAKIALEGKLPEKPFVAPAAQSQLDRIRAAFAPEIAQGLLEVVLKGDVIAIRVGNLLLFDSGKAEVKGEFAPLAARMVEVIDREPGPVRVWGYTDTTPMSGRGRFKTNLALSQARAEAVRSVLAAAMADPARLSAEGKGEAEPIGDNATPEGRAQNRRVEVMIAREGMF